MIWLRESAAVSEAKSASRIRLRDALRFSLVVERLLIVLSSRFWSAPRSAREAETCSSARSMVSIDFSAPSRVLMSTDLTALVLLTPKTATSFAVVETEPRAALRLVPLKPRTSNCSFDWSVS